MKIKLSISFYLLSCEIQGKHFIKRLCQKKQCFSQVLTAYCEWNPRKTHAVTVFVVGQPFLTPLQIVCAVLEGCVSRERDGSCVICATLHFSVPWEPVPIPVDTIQLFLVVSPEVTKPAGMSYTALKAFILQKELVGSYFGAS